MSIRIQIVTEKWNPISAAIRYSTRSWASHLELIDTEAKVTLGARAGGVQLRDARLDNYSRVEQFTFEGIEKVYEWCKTQIGKPYDYSAIFGMAADRDWHDESKWFCSELPLVGAEKMGCPVLSTRPSAAPYRVTPRDWLLSRLIFYLPLN